MNSGDVSEPVYNVQACIALHCIKISLYKSRVSLLHFGHKNQR